VISEYVDGDLAPWSARAIAVYAQGSPLLRVALVLRASYNVLRLSPSRTAGVHIHISQNFDLVRSLLLVYLARLRHVPAVATIHGSRFVRSARKHPHLASRLMRSVAVVTALNEQAAAVARAMGARKVVALPNPMSCNAAPPRVARGTDTVLFAGEIGHRKGVDTLLAAWPRVQAAHVGARLRLIGPVPDEALLERMPSGVVVEGPQSRAFVRAALEEAAVAVLPSTAEALPMFVLEAMAAGIPVVVTPVGGLEGAVRGAGIVVPVGDDHALAAAISNLLADPARADALGSRGTAKVRDEYGAASVLPKFAQLYAGVFARSALAAEGPR
jgi:glycosyltransferase involved in cell wall biosynthesis